jgi:hypothetical protein
VQLLALNLTSSLFFVFYIKIERDKAVAKFQVNNPLLRNDVKPDPKF